MSTVKGTGPDSIYKLIKARGPEFEQAYLNNAGPEERRYYESLTTVSKRELVLNDSPHGFILAAKMLYPNDLHPIRRMGYESALISVPVFYKIFIRIPSPGFVLKRTAALWRQYHDTGEAFVEDLKEKSCTVIVKDYPALPAYLREYLSGFYEGIASLVGVKNVKVIHIATDPDYWKWKLSWD